MADRARSHDTGSDRVHGALVALLTPALADAGFLLEDLRLTPAGKHRVLRVLVDRAEPIEPVGPAAGADRAATAVAGLSLDEVSDASRAVSAALDAVSGAADPLGSAPYTLEVSSPGVDRALTLPRHFRRNLGRLVVLDVADGPGVTGRIVRADGAELVLVTDHGERAVPWGQVERGRVQVEFTRRDAPAGSDIDDDDIDDSDVEDRHVEDTDEEG